MYAAIDFDDCWLKVLCNSLEKRNETRPIQPETEIERKEVAFAHIGISTINTRQAVVDF